jgi:hypothetical protein
MILGATPGTPYTYTMMRAVSLAPGFVVLLSIGVACSPTPEPPHITTAIAWADHGVWLKSDFHTHTKFTDGGHTVEELASAAVAHGCQVLGVADHGDEYLKGATPEYLEAIRAARAKHAEVTVITGMEWNVPPGKGLEHATVLFPAAMESIDVLGPFKQRFDDFTKKGENPELAIAGLKALVPANRAALAPVMFFNHPSRKPESTSTPQKTFEALHAVAPGVLVGVEGAPGHQKGTPRGSYPPSVTLVDRWDPIVGEVGGTWDQWLRKGLDVWGAIADSDFHEDNESYWPCEFAATWVYAPDRSVDGVLRALHAGSFFAEHGHIVADVVLRANTEGLSRPAIAGESLAAPAGAKMTVTLEMRIPAADFAGHPNRIDQVELIGVSAEGAKTLFNGAPNPSTPEAFRVVVQVPAGGLVLRARGRRLVDGDQGLAFYTNPIRISVN